MNEAVAVKSGGVLRSGWQNMQLHLSIEQMANQFSFVMNNRPEVNGVPTRNDSESANLLVANELVQVSIGGDVLLTGFVDDYKPSYNESGAKVQINGRSRTADIVDCSGFGAQESKKYNAVSLSVIASGFAEYLGVKLVVDDGVDLGDPITATLESGENIGEFLERLARYRGLIFNANANGDLVLTKPGLVLSETTIERGKNVLAATASYSAKDIFTNYVVVSQLNDSDSLLGASVANRQRGEYVDALLGDRFRPKVILSDKNSNAKECKTLAEWHARTRRAQGRSITYTLHGWREQPDDVRSPVWMPGKMVPVYDEFMRVDGERLIVSVTLEQDKEKRVSHITVAPREGYEITNDEPDQADDNIQQKIIDIAANR